MILYLSHICYPSSFIPSFLSFLCVHLSCFVDLDDDVAGATFMAAGGSAPELFTSLMGTFDAHSSVGFGTIIGSAGKNGDNFIAENAFSPQTISPCSSALRLSHNHGPIITILLEQFMHIPSCCVLTYDICCALFLYLVFNVLFVIGMCAVFSKEVLVLTWWPLFRDCTFYTVALILLALFFGSITPQRIDWYEALFQFGWYLFYVWFMANNSAIKSWVMKKLGSTTVTPGDVEVENLVIFELLSSLSLSLSLSLSTFSPPFPKLLFSLFVHLLSFPHSFFLLPSFLSFFLSCVPAPVLYFVYSLCSILPRVSIIVFL